LASPPRAGRGRQGAGLTFTRLPLTVLCFGFGFIGGQSFLGFETRFAAAGAAATAGTAGTAGADEGQPLAVMLNTPPAPPPAPGAAISAIREPAATALPACAPAPGRGEPRRERALRRAYEVRRARVGGFARGAGQQIDAAVAVQIA
jgi:hypothetical protein